MDLQQLPFFQLTNDALLNTIWSSDLVHNMNSFQSCLNLLNDNDIPYLPKWDPNQCKYITTDQLNQFAFVENNFTIIQINVRSIKQNFMALTNFINTFNVHPTIISMAETWLKKDEDRFYNIPGYNFVSHPRLDKVGGGVGFYISNKFNYTIKNELMSFL